MPRFSNENGFSLLEVVVAMALLLVTFVVSTQLVMNTVMQSEKIDRSFSSVELADSILDVYQTKPVKELQNLLNRQKNVEIVEILNLEADNRLSDYQATVAVIEPEAVELRGQLLRIRVVVETTDPKDKTSELEGYVEL